MYNKKYIISCFIILIMLMLYLAGCNFELYEKYETSNPKEYGEYSGHIEMEEEDLLSQLLIFPDEIDASAQNIKYYYRCAGDAVDNTYKLYLSCTYNDDMYNSEIKRLSEINVYEDDTEKKVMYTDEYFEYPAYVTIYGDYGCYEYALLDSANCQIIYVYSQFNNLEEFVESKYLPVAYSWSQDISSGINIYD